MNGEIPGDLYKPTKRYQMEHSASLLPPSLPARTFKMLFKLIPLALLCSVGLVHAAPLEHRDLPANYNGKFIITVQAVAIDGKADQLQQLVSTLRAHSTNPQLEPETLTWVSRFGLEFLPLPHAEMLFSSYRVARGFDDERNTFTIIEE